MLLLGSTVLVYALCVMLCLWKMFSRALLDRKLWKLSPNKSRR